METRDSKIVSGFLTQGFSFNGVHYKPISARTLLLLEKVSSPFYFGGNQLQGLIDFLYVSSHDSKEILSLINSGDWESSILDYAETFTSSDLEALGKLVDASNEDASAAIVEVREEAGSKPGKK